MRIMVMGDVHGDWSALNELINRQKPDIILQCGDWGYWENWHGKEIIGGYGKRYRFDNYGAKNGDTKIYWADGNHEDHWSLMKLTNNEIMPNVFYMKRGSTLTLPDGRVVLFIGGANSIDKQHRTFGVDWFPEETITTKDIMNLPDQKIDMVISHTCPDEFLPKLNIQFYDDRDSSRKALSYVLETYRPREWYFGHFHQSKRGYTSRCNWTCLNMSRCTGWWKWLEK